MSILSSLYTGVSGLNANGQWLSVIGDNIANVNTVGFKSSTMSFGDILSQSFTGGGTSTSQIGRGVNVDAVTTIFSQGTFETTSSGLDIAIDGEGFFIVNSAGTRAYTRAGAFKLDDNGNIVNSSGAILQGYVGDTNVIGNLNVSTSQSAASATSTANISANLNADDTAITTAWGTWTAGTTTAPTSTLYNESTSLTVYDSLGGAHQLSAYLTKTADNTWSAHYVYQDANGNYQNAGTQEPIVFTDAGVLQSGGTGTATIADWGNGSTTGQAIAVDLTGTTQYASDFSVNSLTQNGYSSGSVSNIAIGEDGVITGTFTNGQTRTLGQVALARFNAPTELAKLGNNLYAQSSESGTPIVGAPETSGLGRTLANSLELSTVDLAEQFTQLITAQRGFQANTKIITTTDELLNLLISIKQ
jgi:flagellar hook protein FlgE